ncbi:MAG: hypothetical protein HRU14_04945 [Planctomycetes bacterium]|nr:hypothetical protein [Planctomycetota bacterium]
MADESSKPSEPDKSEDGGVATVAKDLHAQKPSEIRDKEWRRHRLAAGHMVIVRSHFKSIFLIPMVLISVVLGIFSLFTPSASDQNATHGLIWICCFCLYMNVFIFEWSRAWTFALILSVIALIMLGFLLDAEHDVWGGLQGFLANLDIKFSTPTYWFFAIFFGICVGVSFLKTRLNYVVVESNEVQLYRNALFGDRERISMLNPRVEVLVPDMLEYFHPFYRAGTMIIHAPNRSIVLDNVLHIRRIERATDRLGSALSVRVAQ